MIRLAAACALAVAGALALPSHGLAQGDPAQAAEDAASAIERAALALSEAEGARDRVRALTETVRAYEDGLAVVRDGIRQAALRERVLQAELAAGEAEVSSLLGVLLTLQTSPETAALLHPAGPVDTARAGMLLADVTPALNARVARLRDDLDELTLVRGLQENAMGLLRAGLDGVRDARTGLSQAIAERTAANLSSDTDMATMQALLNSADTLRGFVASLAAPSGGDQRAPALATRRGSLPLPAPGTLVTGFGKPDSAGLARPGIVLATEPGTLVTAPVPATLRYAGPFLDRDHVAILEPEPGFLLILSGLGLTYGAPGDILSEGDPLGLMRGKLPSADQILIETREGGGQSRPETLYIELRQDDVPLDPEEWFAATAG